MYFYRNFHDHNTRVGLNRKTVNTFRMFRIEFREWLLPHFYYKVTDWWQYQFGWRKQGFLDGAEFFMKKLTALKKIISKRQLFFQNLTWEFMFLILSRFGKKTLSLNLWVLEFPNILHMLHVIFPHMIYFNIYLILKKIPSYTPLVESLRRLSIKIRNQ